MERKTDGLSIFNRLQIFRYRKARRHIITNSEPWVLSRTACLGNDLYRIAGYTTPRLNIQKGRADYLLTTLKEPYMGKFPSRYYGLLDRGDIWPLVVEQESRWWRAVAPPRFILMDSFSELTDQLFVDAANRRSFCANYHDLGPELLNSSGLTSFGLLPASDLSGAYKALFAEFHRLWPSSRIHFIHFPSFLETRALFLERAEVIRDAITRIALSDSLLTSIELSPPFPPFGTAHPDEDWMPYHYGAEIYSQMGEKLRSVVEHGK